MEKKLLHRRSFLKTATGTTVAAIAGLTQAGRVLAQEPEISQRTLNTTASNTQKQMEIRRLGKSLEVSAIGLGCLPAIKRTGSSVDKDEAIALLRQAYENGVTFFYTAQDGGPYIREEWVGEALEPVRQKVKIATGSSYSSTVTQGSPSHISKAVEDSLRRLRTDHIDLLFQRQENPKVPVEEIAYAVKELVKEGKVLHWGLVEPTAEAIRRAHAVCPIAAVQSEYSIWHREPERRIFPTLEAYGIGFVPYGTLGHGFFAGITPAVAQKNYRNGLPQFAPAALVHNMPLATLINKWATSKDVTAGQFALAWMLSRKPWIVPIPATSNKDHLADLLGARTPRLTAWEIEAFDQDVAKVDLIGFQPETYLKI